MEEGGWWQQIWLAASGVAWRLLEEGLELPVGTSKSLSHYIACFHPITKGV